MMSLKKTGQSAMEYLLTYGWAILVVMVVGITMWQLGVFNIGGTVPPRVTGTNYQKPLDATLIFKDTCAHLIDCLQLDFVNGEPGKITYAAPGDISATINDNSDIVCGLAGMWPVNIEQGEKYTVYCLGNGVPPSLSQGEVATAEITLDYTLSIVGVTRSRIEVALARGPVE